MKTTILVFAFAFSAIAAGSASAQVGLTGEIGTSGIGAHVTLPLQPNLNLRLGAGYLSYSYSGDTTDVNYDYKLKVKLADALLDYYPMDGTFRLSAGIAYNGNSITATGKPKPGGTYTINGTVYQSSTAGRIDGNVDFRKGAPYLGIGWGNALVKEGWGFSSDIGVLIQGTPDTTLVNSNCTALSAVCTQLKSDVAAENAKLKDDVSSFKAYPIIRFGASYRF